MRLNMAWVAALVAALPCWAGPAAADRPLVTHFGPFTMQSDSQGQVSSSVFEMQAQTNGPIEARYVASRGHCSSLKVHFEVDGAPRAMSGVLPAGGDSGYVYLGRFAPGAHKVALRAEGVAGGCNLGRLQGWSGDAFLRVTASGDPSVGADLGAVVIESAHVNWAWGHSEGGCWVGDSGVAASFDYPPGSPAWKPVRTSDGLYEAGDLTDRFSLGRAELGQIPAGERRSLAGMAALIGRAAAGPISRRQAMNDAGEATLTAYVLNPGRGAYRAVLLSGSGDQAIVNHAPAAADVIRRLKALTAAQACLKLTAPAHR